jgi:Pre-toxin TG
MGIRKQIVQYGNRKLTQKLMRAMPWVGGVVALATLGAAVRRKGALRGTADTVLDFIPFVGGVKNAAEIVRGRDLISNRP